MTHSLILSDQADAVSANLFLHNRFVAECHKLNLNMGETTYIKADN